MPTMVYTESVMTRWRISFLIASAFTGWRMLATGAASGQSAGPVDLLPDEPHGWTRIPFPPSTASSQAAMAVDPPSTPSSVPRRGHEWLRYDKELPTSSSRWTGASPARRSGNALQQRLAPACHSSVKSTTGANTLTGGYLFGNNFVDARSGDSI